MTIACCPKSRSEVSHQTGIPIQMRRKRLSNTKEDDRKVESSGEKGDESVVTSVEGMANLFGQGRD
jgi:hypothetical protein